MTKKTVFILTALCFLISGFITIDADVKDNNFIFLYPTFNLIKLEAALEDGFYNFSLSNSMINSFDCYYKINDGRFVKIKGRALSLPEKTKWEKITFKAVDIYKNESNAKTVIKNEDGNIFYSNDYYVPFIYNFNYSADEIIPHKITRAENDNDLIYFYKVYVRFLEKSAGAVNYNDLIKFTGVKGIPLRKVKAAGGEEAEYAEIYLSDMRKWIMFDYKNGAVFQDDTGFFFSLTELLAAVARDDLNKVQRIKYEFNDKGKLERTQKAVYELNKENFQTGFISLNNSDNSPYLRVDLKAGSFIENISEWIRIIGIALFLIAVIIIVVMKMREGLEG